MNFLYPKHCALTAAVLPLVLAFFILAGCGREEGVFLREAEQDIQAEEKPSPVPEEVNTDQKTAGEKIYVDLCGAVEVPGVYSVPQGSRLFEVIELAGGLREDAALNSVNRAAVVSDGQKIYIPTEEEAGEPEAEMLTAGSGAESGKINLNTAGVQELMTLPGIGEAKAAAIIRYREKNGPFASVEDLMKVGGIKQAVFDQLRDSVTVN